VVYVESEGSENTVQTLDLAKMSLRQLVEYANDKGIYLEGRTKKEDVIAIIEAHEAGAASSGE